MKVYKIACGLLLAGIVSSGCGGEKSIANEKNLSNKCESVAELEFLCGIDKPEDIVPLSGGRWLIASSMAFNSGLHLISAETGKWERWKAPPAKDVDPAFKACPSQLAPEKINAHGLSIREQGNGRATLYVVNHKGEGPNINGTKTRESIEVFDINSTDTTPVISWKGCIVMPGELAANSVVSAPDGSIYFTMPVNPGVSASDIFQGKNTGSVYKWTPKNGAFERIAGTDLAAPNGIELSEDGKTIYVASFLGITSFTNSNPARIINDRKFIGHAGDNIHWSGKSLILAGEKTRDCPRIGSAQCMSGYVVAMIEPNEFTLRVIAEGGTNPAFPGVSSAALVGNTVWIGSYLADRIAYRILP